MENVNNITVLFGSLISILLSVVAYFIKQLHTDFKRMEKDLVEVKTMALIIKTEFKSGNDLLAAANPRRLTSLGITSMLAETHHSST
jgi:hypothetical protein